MFDNYEMGENLMLSFKTVNAGWVPVGCITSVNLDKTTERIEYTARGSGGNKSYRPGDHDYGVSIAGILSKSTGVVSCYNLDKLQEERVIFEWRLMSPDGHIAKQGRSFIERLGLAASAGAWVSFTCNLAPGQGGISRVVLIWSENGLNAVSEDGLTNVVQVL